MEEKIIVGDCVEGMKALKDNAYNLIIADPPYNLNKDFGVWKEAEKRDEWQDWMKLWLSEALRVLSNQGNIFVYGIHHHQCWVQCIMYDHSKKNGDDEDNGDDLQIEEMVEIFSRGISPVILPTIESLGAMDIQEAMAFSSSAGDVD